MTLKNIFIVKTPSGVFLFIVTRLTGTDPRYRQEDYLP